MTSDSAVLVRAAIRWDRAGGPPPYVRHRPVRGEPGEMLVVTDSSRLRRIVLVLNGPADGHGVARVALATPATEMATDRDLIVGAGEAGFPFPLAIQSDITAWIDGSVVESSIGRLGRRWFDAVVNAQVTDGASLRRMRHGRPLGSASDPRRRFRQTEAEMLRRIGLEVAAASEAHP